MNKDTLSQTVEKAKNGNKQAFEKLYNKYYDSLYFFVLKNVKNKETAEDITQETFLKSMEKLPDLKKTEQYSSWLHSIAYNKCRDFFRSQKHSEYFSTDEEFESAVEEVSLNEPIMLPDDYAVSIERKKQLKAIIDELKPDMKSAVILYYYDNLSVNEVAKVLGIKENSAKQKLFQARKKLKQKIDKLVKGGAVMCAVPINNILHITVSPKCASAARSSSAAAVKVSAVTAKIAGISAAAMIAVGIPVCLRGTGNDIGSFQGNVKVPNFNAKHSYISDTDSRTDPHINITDNDSYSADDSLEDLEYNIQNNTESQSDMQNDFISNDSSSENDNKDSMDSKTDAQKVDMSVEKLRSASVNELLAMSDNKYEMLINHTRQEELADEYDMLYNDDADLGPFYEIYSCAAFPNYGFQDDGDGKVAAIYLYEGASINDKIKIGMTYNELKALFGEKIYLRWEPNGMRYASEIILDGKNWWIYYDMTDEQLKDVKQRIEQANPDVNFHPYYTDAEKLNGIDISDINPKSCLAEWSEHGDSYKDMYNNIE